MRRRDALGALSGGVATLLAGCLGGRDAGAAPGANRTDATSTDVTNTGASGTTSARETTRPATDDATARGTDAATTDATPRGTVAAKHHERQYSVDIDKPVARDLGLEPTLGSYPTDTKGLIVEFQDPSCPYCARFDAQVFPTLYANLLQTGEATFVNRDFPHVKPWTDTAVHAFESTYARDESAYWSLKSHVYANQDGYTASNFVPRLREFLATETTVDADAVVRDVEGEAYSDAVQRDLDVKDVAGITVTPTFVLFRDGERVTRFTGVQPSSVFENALQL